MEELEMEMAVDGSKSAKRKFSNCSRGKRICMQKYMNWTPI